MAVDLAKYVVSLEAETARYTQQLEYANRKLEGFETRNRTALMGVERQFTSLGTRFNQVGRGMRDALALFGVAFGARAFSRWAADAMKSAEATDKQREAFDGMRLALGQLNDVIQTRSLPLMAKFAEVTKGAAEGWRMFLAPSETEAKQKEIRRILDDIELTKNAIGKVENMGIIGRVLFGTNGVADLEKDLAGLQQQVQDLLASIVGIKTRGSDKGLEEFDLSAIHKQMQPPLHPFVQFEQDARVAAWEDRMKAGQKLTEQMATDVEKQVAAWREAKELLAGRFITPETLRRLDEEQLQFFDLNEIHAKLKAPLKQMQTDAEKTAQSIGMSFQNAFADWILGVDRSFSDLLKRMAVQMATSAIFKGLAGLFAPSSFFANFFGGFRAEGGPVSAGRAYVVGENGPELFMPNHSGMIAAGGGGGITIVNNIDARGADPSVAARLPQILAENNQRLKAEIRHERNRGR